MDAIARRRQSGQVSVYVTWILLVGAAYLALTFLPPWYKSWKAKGLMGEAIAGMTLDGLEAETLRSSIIGKLEKIGVSVREEDVEVEINRTTRFIKVSVDWKARIKYPFTKKYTTIKFFMKARRKGS